MRKKGEIMEMINMAEAYQGVISEIRNDGINEGRNQGRDEGKKSIISRLLKKNSVEEVAEFICKEGLNGDVEIITSDGDVFITTFGIYLDKVKDEDYRNELVKVLVPMQKKLDGSEECCDM